MMFFTLVATLGLSRYAIAQDWWSKEASTTAAATTYACNPAHDYGNGQSCIETDGSLTLVSPSTSSDENVSTSCTTMDLSASMSMPTTAATRMTTYACNPAHFYGNGASCISANGSLTLVLPSSTNYVPMTTKSSPGHSNSTRTASSASTPTTYPCNPAHHYPYCATCSDVSGTLMLVTPLGGCYGNSSAIATSSKVYTTKVVTAYTTYCPSSTTFSTHDQTYTVTRATTLTICPDDCTVSVPVTSSKTSMESEIMPTESRNASTDSTASTTDLTSSSIASNTASLPAPTTCSTESQTSPTMSMPASSGLGSPGASVLSTITANASSTMPMETTTSILTAYTTYCPNATVVTVGTQLYTITEATTLTVPGPITVTSPVSQPPVYSSRTQSSAASATSSPVASTSGDLTSTLTDKTTEYSTIVISSQTTNTYPALSSSGMVAISSMSSVPVSNAASNSVTSPVASSQSSMSSYSAPSSAASSLTSSLRSSISISSTASTSTASAESSMPVYSAPTSSSVSSVYHAHVYSAPPGWAPSNVRHPQMSIANSTSSPYSSAATATATGIPMTGAASKSLPAGGVIVVALVVLALC